MVSPTAAATFANSPPSFQSASGAYGGTAEGGSISGDFTVGGSTGAVTTVAIIGGLGLTGFVLWLLLKK